MYKFMKVSDYSWTPIFSSL